MQPRWDARHSSRRRLTSWNSYFYKGLLLAVAAISAGLSVFLIDAAYDPRPELGPIAAWFLTLTLGVPAVLLAAIASVKLKWILVDEHFLYVRHRLGFVIISLEDVGSVAYTNYGYNPARPAFLNQSKGPDMAVLRITLKRETAVGRELYFVPQVSHVGNAIGEISRALRLPASDRVAGHATDGS